MEVETTNTIKKDVYKPEELKTIFGCESVADVEARLEKLSDDDDNKALQKVLTDNFKAEKPITRLMNTLTNDAAKHTVASKLFWDAESAPEAKEAVAGHHLAALLSGKEAGAPEALRKVFEAAKTDVFPYIAKSRVLKVLIQILDYAENAVSLGEQLSLCRAMLDWADPELFTKRKLAAAAAAAERRHNSDDVTTKKKDDVKEKQQQQQHRTAGAFIVYRLELRECAILYANGVAAVSKRRAMGDDVIIFPSKGSMDIEGDVTSDVISTSALEEGLGLVEGLVRELKVVDERGILVEAQLLESKFHYMLRNPSRSKASLTAARSGAMMMYCPQGLQADLDIHSGTVNADEKDYKTAFSYFFEAFEGYVATKNFAGAENALAAMLLCKVMMGCYADTPAVIHAVSKNKSVDTFFVRIDENPKVRCMADIAKACKERSLNSFLAVLASDAYAPFLAPSVMTSSMTSSSPVTVAFSIFLRSHFVALYNSLLEKNIGKIIEPFSCVEVAHIAKIIDLPPLTVEKKLSQMILDKKINGILDQGAGTLIIFEENNNNNNNSSSNAQNYGTAIDIIHSLDKVVDSLYAFATKH